MARDKSLRLWRVEGAEDGLVHHAYRRQFQRTWAYIPICQPVFTLTVFTLPKTLRIERAVAVTCVTCVRNERRWHLPHEAEQQKVLGR